MGQCASRGVFHLSLSFLSLSLYFHTQVTLLLYRGNLACSMKEITLSAQTNTVVAHTSTEFLTVGWGRVILAREWER